jgi:hypothetical protein
MKKFRFILAIIAVVTFTSSVFGALVSPNMFWFISEIMAFIYELGIAFSTWPAFLLSFIIGNNNLLVKTVDCFILLTPLGVAVVYGGLLALTYIIPPLFQKKIIITKNH